MPRTKQQQRRNEKMDTDHIKEEEHKEGDDNDDIKSHRSDSEEHEDDEVEKSPLEEEEIKYVDLKTSKKREREMETKNPFHQTMV